MRTTKSSEPDWRDAAACVGRDLDLFFPISTSGQVSDHQVLAAKAVCAGCPVRRDCLEWALAVGPEFGIFGGHTEVERRMLRQGLTTASRVSALVP